MNGEDLNTTGTEATENNDMSFEELYKTMPDPDDGDGGYAGTGSAGTTDGNGRQPTATDGAKTEAMGADGTDAGTPDENGQTQTAPDRAGTGSAEKKNSGLYGAENRFKFLFDQETDAAAATDGAKPGAMGADGADAGTPDDNKRQQTAPDRAETDGAENGAGENKAGENQAFDIDEFIKGLPPELKEFAADYPEEAKTNIGFMVEILKKMQGESGRRGMNDDVLNEVLNFKREIDSRKAEMESQMRFNEDVMKVHPDAMDILRDRPDFADWLKGQPKAIQREMFSKDPEDAIELLNLFKKASTKNTAVQNKRNNLYRGVPATGKRTAAPADESSMSFEELYKTLPDPEDD